MIQRSPANRIMVIQGLADLMRRSGDGGSR